MIRLVHLARCSRAAAAAEMALALPLLLVLIWGPLEIGNYFMSEHVLVKAVRDGARYAARQDFSNFSSNCGSTPGGTVQADTRNVVMTGLASGGSNLLRNWNASTITVTVTCTTTSGGQTMGGIYNGNKNSGGTVIGAPVVTVSAVVPYTPIVGNLGFRPASLNLNAEQQAAVMGI